MPTFAPVERPDDELLGAGVEDELGVEEALEGGDAEVAVADDVGAEVEDRADVLDKRRAARELGEGASNVLLLGVLHDPSPSSVQQCQFEACWS